jgi:hypothetical protein
VILQFGRPWGNKILKPLITENKLSLWQIQINVLWFQSSKCLSEICGSISVLWSPWGHPPPWMLPFKSGLVFSTLFSPFFYRFILLIFPLRSEFWSARFIKIGRVPASYLKTFLKYVIIWPSTQHTFKKINKPV